MIKLSARLQIVYDMLEQTDCIADIGCDHGYLSIAIAEGAKASKVIAMDVNRGPLETAKKNVCNAGFSDVIELRLSDGLKELDPHEASAICICGMGGVLMKRILSADVEKAKSADYLILEPQSEYMELRTYLGEEGFVIDDEDIISEERKTYPIIKVHYEAEVEKRKELSELELKFGPFILQKKSDIFLQYLSRYESEITDIKTNLEKKMSDDATNLPIQARIEQLTHELDLIKEAKS